MTPTGTSKQGQPGEKTLKAVWALGGQNVELKNTATSKAEAVVPAVEAFLARHDERLQVRRGTGTKLSSTIKVHPLQRAIVAHFDFLEIRLNIRAKQLGRLESPLSPLTRPRYGWLATRPA